MLDPAIRCMYYQKYITPISYVYGCDIVLMLSVSILELTH